VHFLSRYSIKAKIFVGFALMQGIIVAVSVTAFVNLRHTETKVVYVTEDIQPTMLMVMELQNQIEKVSSSLGFYLLSHEESYRNAFVTGITDIEKQLTALQKSNYVQSELGVVEHVENIRSAVEKFKQLSDRMLPLATDQVKNIPGIAYASHTVNPISQEMLQIASGMVQSESDEEASEERRQVLLELGELRYTWVSSLIGVRAYLAYRNKSSLDATMAYMESAEGILGRLKNKGDELTLDQVDGIEQFEKGLIKYRVVLKELVKIHSGEQSRLDSYLIRTEVGPLVQAINKHADLVAKELAQVTKQTKVGLVEQVASTKIKVLGLLVVGFVSGILVIWFIIKAIVTRLRQTQCAMDDIVSGEGDLTRRLDDTGTDEIAQLAKAFNAFVAIVQNIIQQVSGNTNRLADASERLTSVTNETSTGAGRQQQETDKVATAVNEMSASGQEVARNAVAAAQAAEDADGAANSGRKIVGQAMDAIDNLATEVENAGEVIDRVEKDSKRIGGVLDVIRDIAEQTNLLALNAAIEAARAGEQGRGFAVVADEVRTLASRTQQSTAEIQTMIERLQEGTHGAVQVMESSRDKAIQAVEQASRAGTSLEEINAAVASIKDLNSQIAAAAEEQSAVAENINQKVVSISDITDQSAAGAQQTASASNELNQLAEELQTLVGQFKV